MERKCSVCGSPMVRTATGYQCSFCANIEPFNGREKEYERKPSVSVDVSPGKNGRRQNAGTKLLVAVIAFVAVVVVGYVAILSSMILKQHGESEEIISQTNTMEEETLYSDTEIEAEGQWEIQSSVIKQALEEIFQRPFEEVTKQDIQSIRYLEIDVSTIDACCRVSYSFEDYRDYASDGINPEQFPYNKEFLDSIKTNTYMDEELSGREIYADVQHFSGVSGLCLNDYDYIDLSAFTNLSYVDAGNDNLKEVVEAGVPVENIHALKLHYEEDISDITEFTSLKHLYLDYCEQNVLKDIEECSSLETLYCIDIKGARSLNEIGRLSGLKTLYIDGSSDGLKDLSMISDLKNLENLAIVDTDILDVHFLTGFSGLKSLCLSENGELLDYTEIGDLVNLEYLDFDLSALHGNQPDYSGIGKLKNLKHLSLNTVYELDFLYELTDLEELEIDLTFYNHLLEPIRNMSHLKTLVLSRCNSQYEDGFVCLKELPELTKLTIEGMSFDDGVDGLFQLDVLKELHFKSCKFYTAPVNIVSSEKLKVLEMTGVEFITMPGPESEYYYVGYNDEEIMQNILNQYGNCSGLEELYLEGCIVKDFSFLKNLCALRILSMPRCEIQAIEKENVAGCTEIEELNLSENTISNLEFAENLTNLKIMDIEDCYVSDLSPLMFCEKLQYVNAKGNPIGKNPLEAVVVEE